MLWIVVNDWSVRNKALPSACKRKVDLLTLYLPPNTYPEVESRTQGSRPRTQKKSEAKARTALLRTDPLEAKDKNARGQGPRTQAQVLSKKKKVFKIFFRSITRKSRFPKNFSGASQTFNKSKNSAVLKARTGHFGGLEASRPRLRTWPSRPRTSKCVLKDVLEDSTSEHTTCTVFKFSW